MKIYIWGSSQHSLWREHIAVSRKWIYCNTVSTFCLYNSLPHTWLDTHLWVPCTHFQCLYVSLVNVQISNLSFFFFYSTAPKSPHFVSASTPEILCPWTLAVLSRKSGRRASISFPSSNSNSQSYSQLYSRPPDLDSPFFCPHSWESKQILSLSLLFIPSHCLGHLHWSQSVTAALLAMLTMEANRQSSLSFLSSISNTRSHLEPCTRPHAG